MYLCQRMVFFASFFALGKLLDGFFMGYDKVEKLGILRVLLALCL